METISKLKNIESYLENKLSLVASESLLYPHISLALSSISYQLTVEGTVGKRYFPVPNELNDLEMKGKEDFCKLFGKDFCDIRPTTATHANISVYLSILKPGDKILSLNISHGGHVSHGHKKSIAGRLYQIENYFHDINGEIDYSDLENTLKKCRPNLVISGGSSCPREVNHGLISIICHRNGAYHLADISHSAGLIASGEIENTINKADFVTFGTQKTFLGPRGGVVLSNIEYSKNIEHSIFPGIEGAMILPQIISKAASAEFSFSEDFKRVQKRIREFATILSEKCMQNDIDVISGGTDNHIVLIKPKGAKELVDDLSELGIRCNPNPIANSNEWGIRFGSTSIAQSRLNNEEVSCLFENLAKYIKDRNGLSKSSLKKTVKEIVNSKKHKIDTIRPGNFINSDSSEERENKTTNALIESKISLKSDFGHLWVPKKLESNFWDKTSNYVIIPTIGVDKELSEVVQYAKRYKNKTKVLIIDACFLSNEPIIEEDDDIYKVSVPYFNERLLGLFKILELSKTSSFIFGKGWSMYIGFLIASLNNIEHVFYLDADLKYIEEYDPLNKLAYALDQNKETVEHAVIATPNRRNEILHGVLNGIDINEQKYLANSRQFIHFLAGERYIRIKSFKDIPWMTNYGMETWLNLISAYQNLKTVQISNDERFDATNSYIKNEVMLMYCSKLISYVINSNILSNYKSFKAVKDFNSKWIRKNTVSILPLNPGKSVENYKINPDILIPSPTVLFDSGVFDKKEIISKVKL